MRLAPCVVAMAALASAAGPPRRLTLEAGSPIEVRVAKTVSSETAHPDERVEFVVIADVKSGEDVVISRGSLAWGTVRDAIPRGRMARDGKLEIEMQGVCAADGSRAPIRAFRSSDGFISQGPEPGAGESLLALPALPLMMFLHGKPRVLPRGRELTVYTAELLQVDSDRVSGEPRRDCATAPSSAAAAPIASADLGVVAVRSTPGSAEIQVDGAFAGNAPATLRLPPGPHRFTVSLPGYKLYDRMVQITVGSEVSLVVILEPKSAAPPAPRPEEKRQTAGAR